LGVLLGMQLQYPLLHLGKVFSTEGVKSQDQGTY
jgi:hypothetical protein